MNASTSGCINGPNQSCHDVKQITNHPNNHVKLTIPNNKAIDKALYMPICLC
jgi:hypothetical protein